MPARTHSVPAGRLSAILLRRGNALAVHKARSRLRDVAARSPCQNRFRLFTNLSMADWAFLQISFGLFKEAQVEFKLCLEQFVSAPSIVRRRCAGAPQLNPSAPLDSQLSQSNR